MAKQSQFKEFDEGYSQMMNLAYDLGNYLNGVCLHLHHLANPQSQSESSRHLKAALAEAEWARRAWLEGGLYGWIMSEERATWKRRLELLTATIDEAQEALERILQKRGIPGVKQVTSTRHWDWKSQKTFVRFEVQLDTGLPDETAEILYDFPEEEIEKVSVTPRHEKLPSDLDKMLENGIDNSEELKNGRIVPEETSAGTRWTATTHEGQHGQQWTYDGDKNCWTKGLYGISS
jgi:hypothetical protein